MSNARDIHAKAEDAREKEQDFLKSLNLCDEASLAYQKENNLYGMSEVQGSRFSAFKHLYQQTQEKAYLVLAKHAAMAAVEIAQKADVKDLAVQFRDLGKAHSELEEYKEAVEIYNKALTSLVESIHESQKDNKDSLKAEILSHLGEAEYFSGFKEQGINHMNEAIEMLSDMERGYEVDVWLSGALMRKAHAIAGDDKQASEEALQKAKEIIDSNDELVLRKQQWEKLENILNQEQ